MTPQDRLAVLQAAIDGKPLQYRPINTAGGRDWQDLRYPSRDGTLNFSMYEFRVKPQPRTFYAIENSRIIGKSRLYDTEADATISAEQFGGNVIKLQEVIEDEGA